MKKNNKKGFTLAELLIVVAIIAVLTAIAIPVFSTQLEKSREATDLANIRAAYAEAVVDALDNGTDTGSATTVPMKSTGSFEYVGDAEIAGVGVADNFVVSSQTAVTVTVNASGGIALTGGIVGP